MIERDKYRSADQMVIVEKYERVIAYLYPIIQRTPRKHGIARDRFLYHLFAQLDLFYQGGKSGQVSKLYLADANLAMLRAWLRFFDHNIKHITPKQHRTALSMIAEVGNLLGSWIKKSRAKG